MTTGQLLRDADVRVLQALEKGKSFDSIQVASAAQLTPSVAEEAIARLKQRGLIKVASGHGENERLVLDREALRGLLR